MLEPHLIPLLFSHEILKNKRRLLNISVEGSQFVTKLHKLLRKEEKIKLYASIEYFINESRNERNSTIEKSSCIPGIQESKYIRTHLQSPIVWCLKFSKHL